MLYSVGYEGLQTPQKLVEILNLLGISEVLDVRVSPFSRNENFSKPQLKAFLAAMGKGYHWCGKELGGKGKKITDENIDALWEYAAGKSIVILCMERNPRDCHRYTEIGHRLAQTGRRINHIKIVGSMTTPYTVEEHVIQEGLQLSE